MRKSKTPQPAVGGAPKARNTGSPSVSSPPGSETSFARDRAVAEPPAAGVREPAAARDVIGPGVRCTIDCSGELTVYQEQPFGACRYTQAQTEAIGDFLRLTEPLWKP